MRNGKPLESRNWMMEKIIDHVGMKSSVLPMEI